MYENGFGRDLQRELPVKGEGVGIRSRWERPQTKVQVSTQEIAKTGQTGKCFRLQHCSEKVSATAKGSL